MPTMTTPHRVRFLQGVVALGPRTRDEMHEACKAMGCNRQLSEYLLGRAVQEGAIRRSGSSPNYRYSFPPLSEQA